VVVLEGVGGCWGMVNCGRDLDLYWDAIVRQFGFAFNDSVLNVLETADLRKADEYSL
jgi:hypothetical protein